MAKVGRPAVEVKRDRKVTFKLTQEEYERLVAYAQAHGQTISKAICGSLVYMYEKEEHK